MITMDLELRKEFLSAHMELLAAEAKLVMARAQKHRADIERAKSPDELENLMADSWFDDDLMFIEVKL